MNYENINRRQIIAFDFDGTLCTNAYPGIGEPNLRVIEYALTRQREGAILILWTCRTGERLREAIEWCRNQGLIFDAVNDNADVVKGVFGDNGRKIFAHLYVDDRSITPNELQHVYSR